MMMVVLVSLSAIEQVHVDKLLFQGRLIEIFDSVLLGETFNQLLFGDQVYCLR
jgi:hypothetical protein